jgi:hypothetical protein
MKKSTEVLLISEVLILVLIGLKLAYGLSPSTLERLQAEADIEANVDNLTSSYRTELIDFINNKTESGIPVGLESEFSTEFLENFVKDIMIQCKSSQNNSLPYLRC